jgi:hypothetical protein
MIDRRAVIGNGQVVDYEPIGIWVQGPGSMDIEVYYLPGVVEWDQDGFWVINRLVENGVKILPTDFLEYHRDTQSPYHGNRGPIVQTEEFPTMDECARAAIAALKT